MCHDSLILAHHITPIIAMEDLANLETIKQGGILTFVLAFLWLTIQHFRAEGKELKAENKELQAECKALRAGYLKLLVRVMQRAYPEHYNAVAAELSAERIGTAES